MLAPAAALAPNVLLDSQLVDHHMYQKMALMSRGCSNTGHKLGILQKSILSALEAASPKSCRAVLPSNSLG
jgi:hypothetical protein